jgi:formyltetrahydrofolate hydrolase
MNDLKSLTAKLKDLNTQSQKINQEIYGINQKIFDAKIKEVFESGALKETTWKVLAQLKSEKGNWSCFTLYGEDRKFKKLSDLLESTYHCETQLLDKVKIRFDDGEIRIIFDDSTTAFDFVKKYELPLDFKHIEIDRDEHKQNYDALDKFLKEFKK